MNKNHNDAVESWINEIKTILREDTAFCRYKEEADERFLNRVAILRECGVDEEFIDLVGDDFDEELCMAEELIIAMARGFVKKGIPPKALRKEARLNKNACRYLSDMKDAGFFDDEMTV